MTPQITDEITRRLLLGQDVNPPAPTVDWHHERQSLGEGVLLWLMRFALALHLMLPVAALLGWLPLDRQVWLESGMALLLAIGLVAWPRLGPAQREWAGWLIMAAVVVDWSSGLLLGDESLAVRAMVTGFLYLPLLLVALSLMSVRTPWLARATLLLMAAVYLVGAQRPALAGLPFLDWRLPLAFLAAYGLLLHYLGVWVRQVDALMASLNRESVLAKAAATDALTGLPNRRAAEAMIDTALQAGKPLALLSIDVDHFKDVNDAFGHEGGDAVLCSLARTLAAHLRSSDTVCRWGGEEFLVLLTGAEADEAVRIAGRLRRAVRDESGGWLAPVTVSVGIAWARQGDATPDVVRRADAAMYRAKGAGRDRVVVAGSESGVIPLRNPDPGLADRRAS
ncbi:MAG: diguanylate cyclase [Steroidobacteraceae bacterium]